MSNATANNTNGIAGEVLRRVLTGGVLLYPLVMHYLIVHDMIVAALAGLAIMSSATALVYFLGAHGWWQTLPYLLMAVAALIGLGNDHVHALFLPPIVFNLFFAYGFGRTLRRGEMPLIERFMSLHHRGEMTPDAVRFARQLTYAWAVFFVSMALMGLMLAIFASLEVWSIFANVINYLLIVALFFGQFVYGYLRYRMPHLEDILPVALRVVRRAARNTSLGR